MRSTPYASAEYKFAGSESCDCIGPEFPDAYLGDLFRAIQVHRVMFPRDTGLDVTGIRLVLVRYSAVGLRSY